MDKYPRDKEVMEFWFKGNHPRGDLIEFWVIWSEPQKKYIGLEYRANGVELDIDAKQYDFHCFNGYEGVSHGVWQDES